MGLTSALFTGLSGLDVNQTWLNVIGNNIANSNTTAFKCSRAMFKPQFYVTDTAARAPDADFGGTNPSQRGLGASVPRLRKTSPPARSRPRARHRHGDRGRRVLRREEAPTSNYTRDGSFSLNSAHQLVTWTARFVQGFGVDANGNVLAGPAAGYHDSRSGNSITARPTQTAVMQGNLDAGGRSRRGREHTAQPGLDDCGRRRDADRRQRSYRRSHRPRRPPYRCFSAGEDVYASRHRRAAAMLPAATFTVNTGSSTVQDLMSFYQQNLGIDTTVPTHDPAPGATMEADPIDPNASAHRHHRQHRYGECA